MNTTYPAPSEGVNPSARPQPAYYAVIPASVRYCKSVPPGAKLLFGEITALCSVEGYCWASTPYFADLYDVDVSTVKRWLASLMQAGFVRVEVNRNWKEQRRIYLVETVPTPGGVAQKSATGSAKNGYPSRKNERQSITENNTKSITSLNVVGGVRSHFVEPGPLPAREVQKQQEQEQKGQAAPASRTQPASPKVTASPFLESWKETKINAVVAATDDEASRKRFIQLLELCDGAACVSLWDDALDALKHATSGSTGLVERPGAYFCAVLVKRLNARGVAVPVGKPSERRAVRGLVAASLAAADAADVGGGAAALFAADLAGEELR